MILVSKNDYNPCSRKQMEPSEGLSRQCMVLTTQIDKGHWYTIWQGKWPHRENTNHKFSHLKGYIFQQSIQCPQLVRDQGIHEVSTAWIQTMGGQVYRQIMSHRKDDENYEILEVQTLPLLYKGGRNHPSCSKIQLIQHVRSFYR